MPSIGTFYGPLGRPSNPSALPTVNPTASPSFTAVRSDDLNDMVGVVIHTNVDPSVTAATAKSTANAYWLYVYRDVGPFGGPGWLSLLASCGLRHIRDEVLPGGINTAAGTFANASWLLLDSTTPAFTRPAVTSINKSLFTGGSLATGLAQVRAGATDGGVTGGMVEQWEGTNESWSNGTVAAYLATGNGPTAIAAAFAADVPAYWANTKITGPSSGGIDVSSAGNVGYWATGGAGANSGAGAALVAGGVTRYNSHCYPGGPPQELAAMTGWGATYTSQWNGGAAFPLFVGECGAATYPYDDYWQFGTPIGQGPVPTSYNLQNSVYAVLSAANRPLVGGGTGRQFSETAQAQQITRAICEFFMNGGGGQNRFGIYEMLNEPFNSWADYTNQFGFPPSGGPFMDYNRQEGNFGLVRGDFSPKPSYTAVQNLLRLMGDRGATAKTFTPGGLIYAINGHSSSPGWSPFSVVVNDPSYPDQIHSVLTQGSDGVFRIPVWFFQLAQTHYFDSNAAGHSVFTPLDNSPARSETLTLQLWQGPVTKIEAYNIAISSTVPQVVATHAGAIQWTQTPDVWVIKVYP